MGAATVPIVPPGVITQEFRSPTSVRRGGIAGVVGNILEWYDFALFGFFAREIGAHFFPADNPTASLLAAFGTFAAGFLMRPVGGALFGWVGDRFGRKQALIWSVLAMAFPSFFIGLLPGTKAIGLAAPVLLLLFRLMQGLAVGGEYMASAVFLVEGSQPGCRGWMGSWGPLGASAGTLLGSMAGALVNGVLPPEAVMQYGWRLPFLAGLAVGLGGLAIRTHYVERVPHQAPAKSPLREAFRDHWRTMVHLVALIAGISVGFYTIFVYSVTWLGAAGRRARADRARDQHPGDGLAPVRPSGRGVGQRPLGAPPGPDGRVGRLRPAGLSPDVAHGAGRDRWRDRGLGRTLAAPGGGRRGDARHHGRARTLAGTLHRAVGGLQRRDGAAGRDDAAGGGLAGGADRRDAGAGLVSRRGGRVRLPRRGAAPGHDPAQSDQGVPGGGVPPPG
jgi:MFS family permease